MTDFKASEIFAPKQHDQSELDALTSMIEGDTVALVTEGVYSDDDVVISDSRFELQSPLEVQQLLIKNWTVDSLVISPDWDGDQTLVERAGRVDILKYNAGTRLLTFVILRTSPTNGYQSLSLTLDIETHNAMIAGNFDMSITVNNVEGYPLLTVQVNDLPPNTRGRPTNGVEYTHAAWEVHYIIGSSMEKVQVYDSNNLLVLDTSPELLSGRELINEMSYNGQDWQPKWLPTVRDDTTGDRYKLGIDDGVPYWIIEGNRINLIMPVSVRYSVDTAHIKHNETLLVDPLDTDQVVDVDSEASEFRVMYMTDEEVTNTISINFGDDTFILGNAGDDVTFNKLDDDSWFYLNKRNNEKGTF